MNTNTTERQHLLAALSAVTQLLERTNANPSGVTIDAGVRLQGPSSLVVSFFRDPEGLAEFAADLGLPLTYQAEYTGHPTPYVEALGQVHGVKIRAWSLGEAGTHERYSAVVAPSALPREWSARVSA